MAKPTYSARALVIKKIKLGETDLILSLLDESGSQLQAIAKGARKPTSVFASRLELYSVADLLIVEGRNLHIIKEARLCVSHEALREDILLHSAAAPVVELVGKISQQGLENARLFPLTSAALDWLSLCRETSSTDHDSNNSQIALSLCAAYVLKACSIGGFRPSITRCASCGNDISYMYCNHCTSLPFSYHEGGVLCNVCAPYFQESSLHLHTLKCVSYLLYKTFSDIAQSSLAIEDSLKLISICKQWILIHIGARLKSLDFIMSSGMFL